MHIMSDLPNKWKFYIRDTSESQETFQMGIHRHNTSHIFQKLTKDTTFAYSLLIVDAYSNIPTFYGMWNITTEEFMEKLDMCQARFVKVDEFGWWDLEKI